jgi:hypothetical protein
MLAFYLSAFIDCAYFLVSWGNVNLKKLACAVYCYTVQIIFATNMYIKIVPEVVLAARRPNVGLLLVLH